MAEKYTVGNLQVVFSAVDETSKAFENLSKNLRAVRNAILNIGKIGAGDMETFGKVIDTVTKKFSPLLNDIKGAEVALADFNGILQRIGARRISTIVQAIEQINKESKGAAEGVKEITDAISTEPPQLSETETAIRNIWETFSERTIKSTLALKSQEEQLLRNKIAFLELKIANNNTEYSTEELRKELARLQAELGNNEKATKKGASGWKKFIKSIGRIALYRAIRRALQLITQSITETIQEFAKLDDNVNNTMSQITSSLQVIKLSFGTAFIPLLQAIEPILSSIAQGFANFANTISQAMATGDTYWAINSKAIQDYREQLNKTTGSLASFDKIQSLNAKDDNSIFFEERQVDKENEAVKNMGRTIQAVKDIISGLWNIISVGWNNIVKPIFNAAYPYINLIISGITKVVDWVGKAILKLDELGLIQPILVAIGVALATLYAKKVISGISTLISKFNLWYVAVAAVGLAIGILSNWDNFNSETKKTITVISSLVAILTAAAIAALALNGALTFGTGAALAITAIAAGAVAIRGMVDAAKGFAEGGIPSVGTLFYAGEAGAETVTVGSSGRTEVTNVSQMETALYNALVRYGRENRGGDSAINVNIDGQKVFEATRRVANRRGLDFSKV